MHNHPKFTIITVTYNAGKVLEKTIQSVISQSYPYMEYIIVEGKSKDNTLQIAETYKQWIHTLVSEPDKGLYDAMNKGIRMATGEVIGILNSDDFFTSRDVLQQVADAFETNQELDAVYGDVHFVHPDNLEKCVRYYSSKIFKRELMIMGLMPAHPTFYLKKECFEKFGLYKTDYKIAADFEFLLRVIYKKNIRMQYLSLDMVTMRTGGASTSGFESHKRIMQEHLRAFRENGIHNNAFVLSLRYPYKIWELMKNKLT